LDCSIHNLVTQNCKKKEETHLHTTALYYNKILVVHLKKKARSNFQSRKEIEKK